MRNLYIIGNGFDIHHGIRCSYRDFYEWLGGHHSGVIDKMDEVYGCCDGDWWSDFEHNLGEIDLMEHAQQVAFENPVALASDHCDSTWNDAQVAVENEMDELYNSLQTCFEEWVAQLNTPSPDKRIYLDTSDAKFLVFNYTRTLENLYGIPLQKVLHIHGEAGKNEKMIIGHNKSKEVLRKEHPTPHDLFRQGKLDEETASTYDVHDEWAWEEMFNQVASMQKPVEKIMKQYGDFFNGLKNVQKIYAYGFSFSDVDMPYMSKIVEMAPLAHWDISCFSSKDRNRAKTFAITHGVNDFSLISLSDVQNPRQLEIEFP